MAFMRFCMSFRSSRRLVRLVASWPVAVLCGYPSAHAARFAAVPDDTLSEATVTAGPSLPRLTAAVSVERFDSLALLRRAF